MSSEITFYDIASAPPLRTFAANPWKIRLALNYKGLPYHTKWVDMPDISSVREELSVPANRTLPDGKPFHTLPVIADSGKVLGDSFEIALYLDEAYTDTPRLFRPFATGLTAALNAHIDGVFTKYAILCTQMPFDPRVQEAVGAMFASRMGGLKVETLQLTAEQQEEKMVEFEASLGELAKAYRHTGGTTDYFWRAGGTGKTQSQKAPAGREGAEASPFLDGDEPVYADFIIGAWLKMFEAAMKPEDFQRVRSWQNGLWGRVVDALGKWSEIK